MLTFALPQRNRGLNKVLYSIKKPLFLLHPYTFSTFIPHIGRQINPLTILETILFQNFVSIFRNKDEIFTQNTNFLVNTDFRFTTSPGNLSRFRETN